MRTIILGGNWSPPVATRHQPFLFSSSAISPPHKRVLKASLVRWRIKAQKYKGALFEQLESGWAKARVRFYDIRLVALWHSQSVSIQSQYSLEEPSCHSSHSHSHSHSHSPLIELDWTL